VQAIEPLVPENPEAANRAGSVAEIVNALEAGADAVKLFPASAFTPRWVSDVRGALPRFHGNLSVLGSATTGGYTAGRLSVFAVARGRGTSLS
jgi:2-dehydro-3-deoxyphosphogluconate aldolase/(4S)-4-hydroxy-2-oxoglutarate aldolase